MNMDFIRKLPIPMDIKKEYPMTREMEKIKATRDEELKKIFTGESDKFLLVIGPCSADAEEPVLDYIGRLKRLEEQVCDKIFINRACK